MAGWLALGCAAGVLVFAYLPRPRGFDPAPLLARGERYHVRIHRDRWGIPHVYGRTDPDVAFGLAYAHCEDDFETIAEVLLVSRGRLAEWRGREAAPADYLFHLLGIPERVRRGYRSELSRRTRELAEAYADGVNFFGALHPERVPPGLLPATGADVVAGFAFRTPFFYGLDRTLRDLFEGRLGGPPAERPAGGPPPTPLARFPFAGGEVAARLGSNAIAVSPRRSADGATRLLVNSHQPWTGPVAWYEARLRSDEGWDMAGGVFPGSPVILHGAGPHLGWASTVNRPDLVDVYRLETDPGDPDRYRLDGRWLRLERREVVIRVRLFGHLTVPVRREVLRSVHGPVIRTDRGTFALRFAGMDGIRQLEQFYRMNRATTFEGWRRAMRMLALPSLNFVYADGTGRIACFYNGQFPERAPGFDWSGVLPGDRSDLIPSRTLPFDAVPQVVDPPSGYVVSANHTPFRATASGEGPREEDFAPELGIETRMTNRARRALALLADDDAIDGADFRRIKFDKRYDPESEVVRLVEEAAAAAAPDLAEERAILRRWRRTAERDDREAPLAILTAAPILFARRTGDPAPEPGEALRAASRLLREHYGRLDPTWGEVNRLRRGALDLPLGGGPDTLRAIEATRPGRDGRLVAERGDSLILFATWDASGALSLEAIHQFGSATLDPRSPHYADQAPLFAEERTRRVPMHPAELLEQRERSYRPGRRAREAEDPAGADDPR